MTGNSDIAMSISMPPTAPIRFMMALPLLRSGFGVTSGISATAGERYVAIAISTSPKPTKKSTSLFVFSAVGKSTRQSIAIMLPPTIYGIRLPIFVRVLSDNLPKIGSINSAKTLSSAITTPIRLSST